MLTATPEQSSVLWGRGVPLSEAQWKFADPSISRQAVSKIRAIEAQPESAFDDLPETTKESVKSPELSWLREATAVLKPVALQNDARRDCEKDVAAQLQTEALYGIGYHLPRSPTDSPCAIPADVWTGKVDWENDTVEGGGMKFVQVRIIPKSQNLFNVNTSSADRTKYQEPPRGRPSRTDEIEAAFRALDAEGAIATHVDNIKSLFWPVIDKIGELSPEKAGDMTGLSDKTLYREIKRLLEERNT